MLHSPRVVTQQDDISGRIAKYMVDLLYKKTRCHYGEIDGYETDTGDREFGWLVLRYGSSFFWSGD